MRYQELKQKTASMPVLVAFVAGIALFLIGCGGGGGISPAPQQSTPGTTDYVGPMQASASGAGTLALNVVVQQSIVTGFWGVSLVGVVDFGVLAGTIAGSTVSATLTSQTPLGCQLSISGSLDSRGIAGTYTVGSSSSPSCNIGALVETFLVVPTKVPVIGTSSTSGASVAYLGTTAENSGPFGIANGALTLTLSQQHDVYFSGTWGLAHAPSVNPVNDSGTAYAIVTGPATLSFRLVSTSSGCVHYGDATLLGTTMLGSFNTLSTPGACGSGTGTFSAVHS